MKIRPSYGFIRNKQTLSAAVLCSAMLTIMLLGQLYAFEDFAVTLGVLLPVNDSGLKETMAAVLVVSELLALPYLLGMYLSNAMRILSMFAGFATISFWILAVLTNAHVENSGLFSTALMLPGGIVAAFWSLLLFGAFVKVMVDDSRFRRTDASS